MHEMNKIQRLFFEAYDRSTLPRISSENLKVQVPIGPYVIDFVYYDSETGIGVAIEIDCRNSFKTKKQGAVRNHGYSKEHFLIKQGLLVIKFTANEIFSRPQKCIETLHEVLEVIDTRYYDNAEKWFYRGRRSRK